MNPRSRHAAHIPSAWLIHVLISAAFVLTQELGLLWALEPEEEPSPRKLKRAPTARIQTDIRLGSQTQVGFQQPTELAFRSFNELVLQVGVFENANRGRANLPDRFQLLCYNRAPVGPTIRVRRGTTFHIRVKNALPLLPNGPAQVINTNSEQPHALCTTNLHTHGLHLSPTGSGDNIFVEITPQKEFTFEYSIPADHPSGTFWYHPHHHGSVAYQLSNGLAGALIIEGSHNDGIPDLEDVPEIAAARERIFVFQLYNYRIDPFGKDAVGRIDATTIYDVQPDARACPAIDVPDSTPPQKGQLTAINGLINPLIQIAPGEVQRWRLIHAAWDLNRRLYLSDKDGQPAADLQFYEISVDGLATGTLLKHGNDPDAGSTVQIAPGQRSDVLIQAPRLLPGEKERVYHLLQTDEDESKKNLAMIVVRGDPCDMRLPDPRQLITCQPFPNIRDDELATMETSEIARDGLTFLATGGANKRYWINKKTFTHFASAVQIRLDTAEEWTVKAVADCHPFHIHVNPFQVVMRQDAQGRATPMNAWRDTLFIQQGETYTIRSRFKDFLGKTVIHCHFLDHEDQGMMMPIEFVSPYQTIVRSPTTALQRLVAPAPEIQLPDVNGNIQKLSRLRPSNTILMFVIGMQCEHCMKSVTEIVSEVGRSINVETEIVVVSSQPVETANPIGEIISKQSNVRVQWLVDDGADAFRRYGCYATAPLHGLVIVDGNGNIRARYVGDSPFNDVGAVASEIRAIETNH